MSNNTADIGTEWDKVNWLLDQPDTPTTALRKGHQRRIDAGEIAGFNRTTLSGTAESLARLRPLCDTDIERDAERSTRFGRMQKKPAGRRL